MYQESEQGTGERERTTLDVGTQPEALNRKRSQSQSCTNASEALINFISGKPTLNNIYRRTLHLP